MINNGFDHFKYSVHIRFIRNTANPYSVYKKPNPNTANPYSAYKKTNPNSFISYSVYKKRNYSVPYIFGFGRIIRIRLTPKWTKHVEETLIFQTIPSKTYIRHAPGYQQKFRPKIQFSKMFEINLKLFKSCTRWCNCDIENKILQNYDF